MLIDIQKCSTQLLQNIFVTLNNFDDRVFWIRNHDNTQQIYISEKYESIWQQKTPLLFEIPLIWLDYLALNNKNQYMKELQERHTHDYLNNFKNLVFYQILQPDDRVLYLVDQCFRFQAGDGTKYVVGMSKVILCSEWEEKFDSRKMVFDAKDKNILKLFFRILKETFGFMILISPEDKESGLNDYREYLKLDAPDMLFSKRERECLYYFCQGKTYKEAAKLMSISPRTVETHMQNIILKTDCSNRIEVVSRFSQYFNDNKYG